MAKPSLREIFFDNDDISSSVGSKHGIYSREFSGSITQRMKKMLSSRFFKLAKAASYLIAHISTRVYGTAMLCFGILGTIMHFLGFGAGEDIANPIVGIIFALLSIPFLLADKPLPIFLQDFKPTDLLFFEFFCMK